MTFVDEAIDAGILLRNVSGSAEKRHIIETTGAGACFLDYDLDGDLDLYIVNGATIETMWKDNPARDALYRNDGGGRFTDVSVEANVAERGWGGGCAVGDYDNDGDPDIYITNFGSNVLFRNEGNGAFSDVTVAAGVGGSSWSLGAAFVDIERDGDLDLYVANYLRFRTGAQAGSSGCFWKGIPVMCGPRGFDGEEDVLYRNNCDGTFTDISEKAGIVGSSYGMGVVAGDLDADGDEDIFVANDSQDNNLFLNDGRGRFTDEGMQAGVALSGDGRQQASMGAALGDYDNDGDEDLFVTNFSDDYHTLYSNEGNGFFVDVTSAAGLDVGIRSSLGWGTGFFDYDNDGDLDLFMAAGHVYPQVDGRDPSTSYRQQNLLFRNEGNGRFADVSSESGSGLLQVRSSRGVAFGDYDNDGDVDLVVTNENDVPTLLRNDGGNAGHWIKIRLIGARSNRDGIGARLRIVAGERSQFREVRLSSGYCSSHDPRVHLGLGRSAKIDRLEIRWPSGQKQVMTNLRVDHVVTVHEDKGIVGDAALGKENDAFGRDVLKSRTTVPASPARADRRSKAVPQPSGGRISPQALRNIDRLGQTGTRQIMAGDYAGGVAVLEKVLQGLPDPAEAMRSPDALGFGDPGRYRSFLASLYDNIGVGLMRAERFDESEAAMGQALSLAPDRAEFHHNLGLCRFHARRYGPSISVLRTARSKGDATDTLSYDLGRALAAAGRCEEAVPELRLALERLPRVDPEGRRAECWYRLGSCLADKERNEEAARAFRESLALVPGYQRALYKLGLALRRMGQGTEAERIQSLFRARQPADEVVRSLKRAGSRTRQERLGTAGAFRDAGLPTDALLEVNKVLAASPQDVSALVMQGELFLGLHPPGLQESEDAFRAALRLEASQPDALAGLGELLRLRGRQEEAERTLRAALDLRPGHPGATIGLARLALHSGGAAAALRILRQAISERPTDASLVRALAEVYASPDSGPERLPQEALRLLDENPTLYGEDIGIRFHALQAAGRKSEAEQLITRSPFLGDATRSALLHSGSPSQAR